MKRLLYIFGALLFTAGAFGQAINCPSGFVLSSSGACGIAPNGYIDAGEPFNYRGASYPATLTGSNGLNLAPNGAGHAGWTLVGQAPVNVQAFDWKVWFYWNGYNFAVTLQNQSNASAGPCPGSGCQNFLGGAGGEGGFSQTYVGGSGVGPNNVWAIQLDGYNGLTNSASFTCSSIQMYYSQQAPFLPVVNTSGYLAQYPTDKVCTSPVQLNSPATTPATYTGDLVEWEVSYDGNTVTSVLTDSTQGTTSTQTWTGVDIPGIVGAATAYPVLAAGTSGGAQTPTTAAVANGEVYTVETPTAIPATVAWNANATYNNGTQSSASPVFSLAPGTYSGTQSVTMTESTTPYNYICYVFVPTGTTPVEYAMPDGAGNCQTGSTKYSSAVSITQSGTLYARTWSNVASFGYGVTSPVGLGPYSQMTAATYIIGGSSPATVTFSGVVKISGNVVIQ